MINETLVLLLCFTVFSFIASNVFWFVALNKMTNKIMSRSYSEFVQAEKLKKEPIKVQIPDTEIEDAYEKNRVNQINNLLGL